MDIISFSKASKALSEIARLDGRCDNLQNLGRYLALWDCTTGKPTTNPTTMPYTYKAGDYYRISSARTSATYNHNINFTDSSYTSVTFSLNICNADSTAFTSSTLLNWLNTNGYNNTNFYPISGSYWSDQFSGIQYTVRSDVAQFKVKYITSGGTTRYLYVTVENAWVVDTATLAKNYKPNGSTYNNETSTTQETDNVAVGDVYFYDGTSWTLQINHEINSVKDVKRNGASIVNNGVADLSTYALIVNCTQAQYDAMTSRDPYTIYNITG